MKKFRIRVASRHPSHKAIIKHGQMPKFPVRVRVRFGSQIPHRHCDVDFNPIPAIERTANKLKMKAIFLRAGVRTPRYLMNTDSAHTAILDGYLGDKIFFKTPYHSRGRGMKVFDDKGLAVSEQRKGYFEEAQVSKREFRVHVMDGVAFYTDEKRPRDTSILQNDRPEIKNMESGFKFRRPIREYPPEVELESIKAVKALGLDFGAADVGVNEDGVWIYEVNTAPSLRTKTRKLYQKALVKAIWKRILGEDNTDEVERLSQEYNNWLDEQPLTD
jgi:glutathione synthase/RimK-type ligase-like ATP-grasp enzyme